MKDAQPSATALRPLILIVDDDIGVRDSLAALIEAYGFRTATAANGADGLETIAREAPSAIVTDLQMPRMDGFQLLTTLRAANTRIPVVAISGSLAEADDLLGAARRMGAVAAFPKPFPVLDLIDALSRLTEQKAAA